jgi:hypothetical protein
MKRHRCRACRCSYLQMADTAETFKNLRMAKNFVLFTAIISITTAMAGDITATPTCSPEGVGIVPGLTCDGAKVVGINWESKGYTGSISLLAPLTDLTYL